MGTAVLGSSRVTGVRSRGPAAVIAAVLAAAALAGGAGASVASAANVRPATAGVISTVAGGVGGPGLATSVPLAVYSRSQPCGVSSSGSSLYVDDGVVRQVSARTGRLITPVGTFASAPVGTGGPAAAAGLNSCGTVKDRNGNLIVTDLANNLVRVVAGSTGTFYGQAMTKGDIYTIAGGGGTSLPAGQPAIDSRLINPQDVTVDRHGDLFFVDQGTEGTNGAELVMIAETSGFFYKQNMTAGDIYRLAGAPTPAGTGVSGDGGPSVRADLGFSAGGVAVDTAGNVLLADTEGNRVRAVAAKSGTFYGVAMTKGDIYAVAGTGTGGFSGDGGPALTAEMAQPGGLALDGAGNLVIADTGNDRIRVAAAATGTFYGQAMTVGDIYTVAGDGSRGFSGDGGPATAAELDGPVSVATDGSGSLLVADQNNQRVRVVAQAAGTFYGQAMTVGDIYSVAGRPSPFDVPCCQFYRADVAQLVGPRAITVDQAGNTLVVEGDLIQVIAGESGTFYGRTMTAGHLYTVGQPSMAGGHPINDIAVDSAGNLLFTLGARQDNKVRALAQSTGTFYGVAMTAGNVYTVAGTGRRGRFGNRGPAIMALLNRPDGLAFDQAGNLLIADTGNGEVRVVANSTGTFYGKAMKDGFIYDVAGGGKNGLGDGGPATSAELLPVSVAVDAAGNLVISDGGARRIRVVADSSGTFYGQAMTAGDIYTVAGGGTETGSGIPATSAQLGFLGGVAIDAAGNVAFTDDESDLVQVVAVAAGTFYGQAMTSGDLYTVAGTGTAGFSGDGGPGTSADLDLPSGVAVDGAGNLLVTDQRNNRIRQVAG
ncbi:MAG TPA: hypothetical protein VGL63_03860 [Streptosporangiaceae bacterium]